MKIPKKKDLLRLQAELKSDRKIAEALGGVPQHLIGYWRRKKNIPLRGGPRFTRKEIEFLWEKHGNDRKASSELGISRAAFYRWRKFYGLHEKPKWVRLQKQQLELHFPRRLILKSGALPQTLVQKIVGRKLAPEAAGTRPQLFLETSVAVAPDRLICHARQAEALVELPWPDGSAPILERLGFDFSGYDPGLFTGAPLRLWEQAQALKNSVNSVEKEKPNRRLWEAEDRCAPGLLLAGTDRSVAGCGALGSWGIQVDSWDVGGYLTCGRIWTELPAAVRVRLDGRLPESCTVHDLSFRFIHEVYQRDLAGMVIELTGEAVRRLKIPARLLFCAIAAEAGITALFPYDEVTCALGAEKGGAASDPFFPDRQALYAQRIELNMDHPHFWAAGTAGAHQVQELSTLVGTKIAGALVGGCGTGRIEDLKLAAALTEGKELASGAELFVVPDSAPVYLEAIRKGYVKVLVEAGAQILPPGDHWTFATAERMQTLGLLATSPVLLRSELPRPERLWCVSPAAAVRSAVAGEIVLP